MPGWPGSDWRNHSAAVLVGPVALTKPCRALLGLNVRGCPSLHERWRPYTSALRFYYSFAAIGFGAGVGYMVALAIEADDEHGASVAVADWLVGSQDGRVFALGRGVAGALAETAMAELVGAAEELDGTVGAVGSQDELHGAVMLIAKRQDVRPHANGV